MHTKHESRTPTRQIVIGALLVISGCCLLLGCPWIVKYIFDNMMALKPNGFTFHKWQRNPVPLWFEIYMFNWTNPEDIYKPNVKPKFVEVGPFVYRQTREKVNITWNSNATITYKVLSRWYYDEEKSVGNLSTKIVVPNVLAMAASHRVQFWSYVMKKGFDVSLRTMSHKIYAEKTVGQLLFDGYEDPLFALAKAIPFPKSMQIPDVDKFGWFYGRNDSSDFDGTFNLGTHGEDFGSIREWNYMNETSYFTGKCNKIKGSTGEFYPTNLQRDNITFFCMEICRPIVLDYSEDVFVDGTRGYKYVVGQSFFDNGTKVPDNLCYASGENIPSGAVNISSCRYGTPGTISLPHFYGADPYYINKLEGLNPKKSKHEMFMVIEPTTGIPLHVEARFQLNILMHPIKHLSLYHNAPKIHVPVVWFQQKAVIPYHLLLLLKIFIYMPLALQSFAVSLILFGIFFLIVAVWGSRLKTMCWHQAAPPEINANESELKLLKKEST